MTSFSSDDQFTPGPCLRCSGTGVDSMRWIPRHALADLLGLTERRVRQLVAEGVIDPPVEGRGFPADAVSQYVAFRVDAAAARESIEIRLERRERLKQLRAIRARRWRR